jgi:hypothetical protein
MTSSSTPHSRSSPSSGARSTSSSASRPSPQLPCRC